MIGNFLVKNIIGTLIRRPAVQLLTRIEHYLTRTATAPTTFGRAAAHDPRFVLDLRNGRSPRPGTAARVHAWLDQAETRA